MDKLLLESRVQGNLQARFGGGFTQTYSSNTVRRRVPTLQLSEEHRIVDAPVTPNGYPTGDGRMHTPRTAVDSNNSQVHNDVNASASEQQISSIRKLSEYLGKAEPESLASMSNLEAKKVIQQLTMEYRQSKKAS